MELLEELKKELEENIESEKLKTHTLETEIKVSLLYTTKMLLEIVLDCTILDLWFLFVLIKEKLFHQLLKIVSNTRVKRSDQA